MEEMIENIKDELN